MEPAIDWPLAFVMYPSNKLRMREMTAFIAHEQTPTLNCCAQPRPPSFGVHPHREKTALDHLSFSDPEKALIEANSLHYHEQLSSGVEMTTMRDVILCPPPGKPPENLPKRRLGRQYRKSQDTDILRVTSSIASERQTSESANGWNRGGSETRSPVASAPGARHPRIRAGATNMIPKVN